MATFKQKLFVEYPIPLSLSIWGGDGVRTIPVEDVDVMISSCIDEVASDILITSYIEATGMVTKMPEGTVTCTSAQLSGNFPFQGNRLVKVTYNKAINTAYVRYFPATITYQRKLKETDLDILSGDRLIYLKCYCLWKMAEKEINILKTANMAIDNGTFDLSVLEGFRDKMLEKYNSLKDEILLYATVN